MRARVNCAAPDYLALSAVSGGEVVPAGEWRMRMRMRMRMREVVLSRGSHLSEVSPLGLEVQRG